MKHETRGFIFLILSVACYCTHQLCDRLWWITAYLGSVRPAAGSILYGGITLFVLAAAFLLLAIVFFIRALKEKS